MLRRAGAAAGRASGRACPRATGPFEVSLAERVERRPLAGEGPAAHAGARGPLPDGRRALPRARRDATRLPVLLFGAGHVGRAIAARAAGLPLHLAWYDSRPEAAETAGVVLADEDAMVACAGRGARGRGGGDPDPRSRRSIIASTAAALGGRARFVGLIGSQTKRARFLSRLAADGVDAARLTCPIGLPGISGREPEVIAIATLAQLLMLRSPA